MKVVDRLRVDMTCSGQLRNGTRLNYATRWPLSSLVARFSVGMCDVFLGIHNRALLVAVHSLPCSVRFMSRYTTSADNTIFYQSIHSTPPRRPSAGVFRHDSLPLPTLSRTQSDYPAISPGPSSHKEVTSDRSFFWPWDKPAVDFDDRERVALVTDEKHELSKVSMKPWEGWRVVLLSSCGPIALSVRHSN